MHWKKNNQRLCLLIIALEEKQPKILFCNSVILALVEKQLEENNQRFSSVILVLVEKQPTVWLCFVNHSLVEKQTKIILC